jgi:hypothetical protein
MERREQSAKGALQSAATVPFRSNFQVRQDKVLRRTGAATEDCHCKLPSFFHLNPPKAGESCQAVVFYD